MAQTASSELNLGTIMWQGTTLCSENTPGIALAAMTKFRTRTDKNGPAGFQSWGIVRSNNDNGGQWVTDVALEVHRSFAAL